MSYYHNKWEIKDNESGKIIAFAGYENGAPIIAKALNFYFGDTYTRNQTVEMMHSNTAMALKIIADFAEKNEFTAQELIEWIRGMADEMEAQGLVVALRDELKFDKAKEW